MRRPGIALGLVGAVAIAAAGLWWQFGGAAARDGIDIVAAASNMPGFEDKLSDADIWAVLSYIKSTWPDPVRQRHDELNRRAQAD